MVYQLVSDRAKLWLRTETTQLGLRRPGQKQRSPEGSVAPAQLPTSVMDDLSFGMASPILGCPNGTLQNFLSDQGVPEMIPELGRQRPDLLRFPKRWETSELQLHYS